jgi:poly(A) polymerase
MKLRELLHKLLEVQKKIGAAEPYLCGGTPRDRYMGRLDNIADLDITTGDKTVDYLSQEFDIELRKQYDVTRKTMEDGHSTIFVGNLKMDFSSNFNVPGIENILVKMGMARPTDMQKEMFSRDFTCNALLLSTNLKNLVDPTKQGFKDIKDHVIRTCLDPHVTLTSNRNRVIRSIYLAAKLGFDIDKNIIEFVRKNPDTIKISTERVMMEKLTEAFKRDPERASHLITQMGLWNYIPIPESVYPYYIKAKGPNVK